MLRWDPKARPNAKVLLKEACLEKAEEHWELKVAEEANQSGESEESRQSDGGEND